MCIQDFNYDGTGPDAFFYVGKSGSPSESGVIVPWDENNPEDTLEKASGKEFTLTLPEGYKASELKWFSVWCRKYSVDFGNVYFKGVVVPAVSGESAKEEDTSKEDNVDDDDSADSSASSFNSMVTVSYFYSLAKFRNFIW